MLSDHENPFAPPRETNTPSPVSDGLVWNLGLREIVVALLVLFGFFAGFLISFVVSQGSVLPFNLDEFDRGDGFSKMWGTAGLAGFFILGLLLWTRGVLFSIGGLLSLAVGVQMWIAAATVIVIPGGSLVVWGVAIIVTIFGAIFLRRRTS
jgi:hypothetical protein